MNEAFIQEKVNINEFPAIDIVHAVTSTSEITIGDLHANAIKLLYFLVRQGVLRITRENYEKIVKIYKIDPHELTQQHINEFNDIISEAQVVSKPIVRLIGDELADRGSNDYFILKIIEKLGSNDVPVRILLSNHGREFYNKYEDTLKDAKNFSETMSKLVLKTEFILNIHGIRVVCLENEDGSSMPFDPMQMGQSISLNNMAILLHKKIISQNEIVESVEKFYKPSLLAVDYTLSENKLEIIIHGHAPIGLETIEALAKHEKIKISYNATSAEALALTIDKINQKFQAYLHVGRLTDLYQDQSETPKKITTDNPFEFIMWNRKYSKLSRPNTYNGYKIRYVHGHDNSDPDINLGHIYNLDDILGKTPSYNEGIYRVFYFPNAVILKKSVSGSIKSAIHNFTTTTMTSLEKVDQDEQGDTSVLGDEMPAVLLPTIQGLVKSERKKSGNPPTELWHLTFQSTELRKEFVESYCKSRKIFSFSKKENRTTNCYSYPYQGATQDERNLELRLDVIAYNKIFSHFLIQPPKLEEQKSIGISAPATTPVQFPLEQDKSESTQSFGQAQDTLNKFTSDSDLEADEDPYSSFSSDSASNNDEISSPSPSVSFDLELFGYLKYCAEDFSLYLLLFHVLIILREKILQEIHSHGLISEDEHTKRKKEIIINKLVELEMRMDSSLEFTLSVGMKSSNFAASFYPDMRKYTDPRYILRFSWEEREYFREFLKELEVTTQEKNISTLLGYMSEATICASKGDHIKIIPLASKAQSLFAGGSYPYNQIQPESSNPSAYASTYSPTLLGAYGQVPTKTVYSPVYTNFQPSYTGSFNNVAAPSYFVQGQSYANSGGSQSVQSSFAGGSYPHNPIQPQSWNNSMYASTHPQTFFSGYGQVLTQTTSEVGATPSESAVNPTINSFNPYEFGKKNN